MIDNASVGQAKISHLIVTAIRRLIGSTNPLRPNEGIACLLILKMTARFLASLAQVGTIDKSIEAVAASVSLSDFRASNVSFDSMYEMVAPILPSILFGRTKALPIHLRSQSSWSAFPYEVAQRITRRQSDSRPQQQMNLSLDLLRFPSGEIKASTRLSLAHHQPRREEEQRLYDSQAAS